MKKMASLDVATSRNIIVNNYSRVGNNFFFIFSSKIGLEMENTLGSLAKITAVIAAEKCNIRALNVEETAPSYAIVSIILDVRSREHLADLIRHLRQLRHVMRVVRVKAEK